jgi:hypothetical protein
MTEIQQAISNEHDLEQLTISSAAHGSQSPTSESQGVAEDDQVG